MEKYIALLRANKNLILTGAPGTGKTYLAKQIAKAMNAETEFVQFHPSYDYTDFVEGLRPCKKDDSDIGFELKDGVFKNFCRQAIESKKINNFDEQYEKFIDDLTENSIELETPKLKKKFKVEISSKNNCVVIPLTDIGTRMTVTKTIIKSYIFSGKILDWKPYTVPIGNYLKKNYHIKDIKSENEHKDFVIIIDEINRAEISKVFGELFFSIDPGYRGTQGRVKTQYFNLQEEGDVFKEGFYVPDNVYIIGTMNDIDRSVESFDFAMRRRFAWKEIQVKDRIEMWDGIIDNWKDEAHIRMDVLNKKIAATQGLGSAFCIGPAYFLKLKLYNGDFQQLWDNHLEGVISEYLRGFPNKEETLEELKSAYNNQMISEQDVEN
ncbi:MAG: AAA family ATPase [Bacteroidales bacterium]